MIYPTLNLDARCYLNDANGKPGLAGFARASQASSVNAIGRIAFAAADTLRHDHDPASGAYLGWLLEEQRSNLLLQASSFGEAVWSKSQAGVTPMPDAAPDGGMAAKLVEEAASGFHHVFQGVTLADGGYCFSLFAKAAGRHWLALEGANGEYAYFDLARGRQGLASGATSWLRDHGDGWYRCAIGFTASAGTRTCRAFIASGDGQANFPGDGASGLLLWGAQLEAGAFPTSFIATTSAAATRAADQFSVATSAFPFNPREGTLLLAGDAAGLRPQGLLSLGADAANSIDLRILDAAGQLRGMLRGDGAELACLGWAASPAATPFCLALAYGREDAAVVIDGGAVALHAGDPPPAALAGLGIGHLAGGALPLCGHVRQVAYFPRRLADADLQLITR